MSKKSWYARTTWTSDDRDDFLTRLRDTVGEHEQAACLRKQAAHLLAHAQKCIRAQAEAATTDQTLAGARELFDMYLDWFPDSSDCAYVHVNLGDIEVIAEHADAAFDHYRAALTAQQQTNRSTNAHLRFGVLALERQRNDLYDEASALLESNSQPLIYPLEQYQHCGIKSLLLVHHKKRAAAHRYAIDALAALKYVAVDETTHFHQQLLAMTSPNHTSQRTQKPESESP